MNSKQEKIRNFDPNGQSVHDSLFGLPFEKQESEVVVLPVPWEVTVSYRAGTARGPEAIKKASLQVDLFDPYVSDAWKMGIYLAPINERLLAKSDHFRLQAVEIITSMESESPLDHTILSQVNEACQEMVDTVQSACENLLKEGKLVILLGGDHSTPLGYIKALAAHNKRFGILQIDAHADLRKAFEGFEFSHASIMHNALKIPEVTKLVQVGIRDFCEEEVNTINNNPARIATFFDRDLKQQQYEGRLWGEQVDEIISHLPENVYLSFDIDGLDPKLCPNTGTPVAGGFEVEEILYLIEKLIESGRTLIGIDLNEVSPGNDEWDANVAARMLYRLSNLLGRSNGRI